ncbi:MAG: LamG-like jellyroll fold domain-containing protein, partial [Patescibacteria group bacterium]
MIKTTKQKKNRISEFFGIWTLEFGVSALRTQRGFTLFYAVLVASLLLAIGIAIFNITFKELVLSSGSRESTNAFYAADSGIECAFYWDLNYSGLSSPAFGFFGDSLASGLQGYWRFEDDTGATVARDSSGKGNDGVLQGVDAAMAWVSGQVGGALHLDGVNDYVEVSDQDSISLTGDLTIAVWVKVDDFANFNGIVGKTRNNIPNPYDFYLSQTSGMPQFFMGNGTGFAVVSGTSAPTLGVWQHLVVVKSGITVTHYRNGSTNGSGPLVTTIADGGRTLRIGSRDDGVTRMKGAVDDLRIYNRALSPTEVSKLSQQLPNPQFTNPISQSSGAVCLGADITDPATGWDSTSGWNVVTGGNAATTTFDIALPDGRCSTVTVAKNSDETTVISRGYNTCSLTDPRRVERA